MARLVINPGYFTGFFLLTRDKQTQWLGQPGQSLVANTKADTTHWLDCGSRKGYSALAFKMSATGRFYDISRPYACHSNRKNELRLRASRVRFRPNADASKLPYYVQSHSEGAPKKVIYRGGRNLDCVRDQYCELVTLTAAGAVIRCVPFGVSRFGHTIVNDPWRRYMHANGSSTIRIHKRAWTAKKTAWDIC